MSNPIKQAIDFFGFGSGATAPLSPAAPQSRAAKVTPIRSRARGYGEISEIATVQPKSFEEAAIIAERFRDGIPVIVNMGDLNEATIRRMLDFMFGLKEALLGTITRVTQTVYLLSPSTVEVTDEAEAAESYDDELVIRP
jgi:cell division inhibitor SepF